MMRMMKLRRQEKLPLPVVMTERKTKNELSGFTNCLNHFALFI
jgi:hypothetical protein